jgi:hypothetical protein
MKKFGLATLAASGLIAAALGFAAPAALADAAPVSPSIILTGIDHHTWLDQIGPNVNVPQVDTSVHQSR